MHTLHYSELHPRRDYADHIASGQAVAAVLLVLAIVIGVPVMMAMGG
jgi:hypothetical protein